MLLQGKTLLASDRLSQLAVQESRLSDGHKRTSEALAWLDRRLESDLAASSRSEREAETDSADPLAPPSREETAAAMRDVLGHETRAEALRKKIEKRGEMRNTSDQTGDPSTHSGTSLSFEAQARLKAQEARRVARGPRFLRPAAKRPAGSVHPTVRRRLVRARVL